MTCELLTQTIIRIRDEMLADGISQVEDINHGYCADFATAVWESLGYPESFVWNDEELGAEDYRHTFMMFEGRFYDAEAPEGVDAWQDLPIYKRPS